MVCFEIHTHFLCISYITIFCNYVRKMLSLGEISSFNDDIPILLLYTRYGDERSVICRMLVLCL